MSFKNKNILSKSSSVAGSDGDGENIGPAKSVSVQAVTTDLTVAAFIFVTADLEVDSDLETIKEVGHGLVTGQKITLSTGGVLPTGLSATDYFVIRFDADKIRLATSYANALAGTYESFSADGSGNHTVTPATLAGTLYLEESNDGDNWIAISGKTSSIATDINVLWEMPNFTSQHIRARLTQADGVGQVDIGCHLVAKE